MEWVGGRKSLIERLPIERNGPTEQKFRWEALVRNQRWKNSLRGEGKAGRDLRLLVMLPSPIITKPSLGQAQNNNLASLVGGGKVGDVCLG